MGKSSPNVTFLTILGSSMAARTSSWEHISPAGKVEDTMYTGVVSGQNSRMNCRQMPHGVVVGAGTSLDGGDDALSAESNGEEAGLTWRQRWPRTCWFLRSVNWRPGLEAKVKRVKEGRRDVSNVAVKMVNSPTCTDHCLGKSRPFGADTGA
jgi:hypothetical protein